MYAACMQMMCQLFFGQQGRGEVNIATSNKQGASKGPWFPANGQTWSVRSAAAALACAAGAGTTNLGSCPGSGSNPFAARISRRTAIQFIKLTYYPIPSLRPASKPGQLTSIARLTIRLFLLSSPCVTSGREAPSTLVQCLPLPESTYVPFFRP